MEFQDNIIKEYLRNVYFVTGTPCGGKTTISRALGKKYGIPVYDIDEMFPRHQAIADDIHQPNMRKQFRDADEFFGRSVEEYKAWLLGNLREQIDFIILDLMKLSQNGPIICDCHFTMEQIEQFSDPSRAVFMITDPTDLVETYCDRSDHQDFSDFIHSATDYEKAKKTCTQTLYELNMEKYNEIKNSKFFWLERDYSRTVEETTALVEEHFGWNHLKNISIQKVDRDTRLADELLTFIENCSWVEVKNHLAGLVKNWEFTDWETFFVAKVDGKIVGMASALKEDYYPMPELYPWVSCVFVSEEYRGHRISEKLIEYANDYLKEQGFERSYIPTPKENMGLYERYGYSFVKEITNYGGCEDLLYSKII
ncbi:GNAT family N-acetyltransferase [Pseudobutyrivibrio xylanivorans]|uniref:Ribosomal protein S18 acetylase RimI n=1 Tax=Pseudobutyrivibrio xylanivorans DSM 14809 TaxID=1123012 RepID=A0A1M6DWI2_PSEXY|nr:GNAT family N-acetyltransferase [Pseudobutyrivibrio xylanivorans]SHI77552.1 Ribosomal protein S18 acetylase RimI [Pseudobutyrivibrio xylanivorans DSM 14809]